MKLNEVNEEKISIERSKRILNKNGYNYSDEEVKRIRDFLYVLAEINSKHLKSL